MSAAGKREELEARLWQAGLNLAVVNSILAAADAYAAAAADEPADGRLTDQILGPARLAAAAAEISPAVHYPGTHGGTACSNTRWRYPPRRVTTNLDHVTCTRCQHSRRVRDLLWERAQDGRAA